MPVSSASPHSGHRSRLRQRLAREPLAVADYEILELLLGYGQPRKDTKPLARELLLRFHNIRGVLEPALRYKASGIILVHNHPGGQTRPSQPDLIFTNTVRELAVNMGLRFLDHVIVTDNGCYSICQCRHL